MRIISYFFVVKLISGSEKVADPAVYGETEWISVMFHGQSFMLHQVRGQHSYNKMRSLTTNIADREKHVSSVASLVDPSPFSAR